MLCKDKSPKSMQAELGQKSSFKDKDAIKAFRISGSNKEEIKEKASKLETKPYDNILAFREEAASSLTPLI